MCYYKLFMAVLMDVRDGYSTRMDSKNFDINSFMHQNNNSFFVRVRNIYFRRKILKLTIKYETFKIQNYKRSLIKKNQIQKFQFVVMPRLVVLYNNIPQNKTLFW